MARGRKRGKKLGPIRLIIDIEPAWVYLPYAKRWVRAGAFHIMECGHRLLVDQARVTLYGDVRCCWKCLDIFDRWSRFHGKLTGVKPLRLRRRRLLRASS